MITIANYQMELTPFTLTEMTTYPLNITNYILELDSKMLQDSTLLFLTGETSLNVMRYNYYQVDLTPYNLPEGTYNYKVWETTGSTLSTSALTTNDVVESGFCYLYSSGSTQVPTYNSPQPVYVFE
jgi:hypothetical protein